MENGRSCCLKKSLFNFIALYILFVMGWVDQLLKQLISFRIFLPFIPLFVAFDALGILPIFVSLTTEMSEPERKKVIHQSILTAFLVGIGFLVVGRTIFVLLGILVSDFQIAGGILLFIISIIDLIFPERSRTFPKETLGIVPIGIPLIVGPAVLTLLLIIVHTYGYFPTLLCLVLNLLIVWFVFSQSHRIMRMMKEGGAKGIGKVFSLLLAAFAMMMIRLGLEGWMDIFRKVQF
jgi:multiple antibiotic resistance protein